MGVWGWEEGVKGGVGGCEGKGRRGREGTFKEPVLILYPRP